MMVGGAMFEIGSVGIPTKEVGYHFKTCVKSMFKLNPTAINAIEWFFLTPRLYQ